MKRIFVLPLSMFFAVPLFIANPMLAQGPGAPRPAQNAPDGGIRVRVQIVTAPVSVRDAKNNVITNLQKEDFHVFDNGVEQTIDSFDLGTEPLSCVFVLEDSSRVAAILPAVRKSAIVFTDTVVGASGEGSVIGYDSAIQQLQPFTQDNDKIERAIANLKTGNTGARLYDAIFSAVAQLRSRPPEFRRVMIVVGEPLDIGSASKLGAALRSAQINNIVIYSVALSVNSTSLRSDPKQAGSAPTTPPGTFGTPPSSGTAQTPSSEQQRSGNIDLLALSEWTVRNALALVKEHPLEIATTATGGAYLATVRDRSIENAVDSIGGELNAQYTLSYRPAKSNEPGYHTIKITLDRPGLNVRTRPGYFLEGQ